MGLFIIIFLGIFFGTLAAAFILSDDDEAAKKKYQEKLKKSHKF